MASALALVKDRMESLPTAVQEQAILLFGLRPALERIFGAIRNLNTPGSLIRCHGDYHLGQVLFTGADFVITDFEGEPARSEEHTSELQSQSNLVCRLLLEKKNLYPFHIETATTIG